VYIGSDVVRKINFVKKSKGRSGMRAVLRRPKYKRTGNKGARKINVSKRENRRRPSQSSLKQGYKRRDTIEIKARR